MANTQKGRDVIGETILAAERVSKGNMAAMIMRIVWKIPWDFGACIIRGVACMIGVAYALT